MKTKLSFAAKSILVVSCLLMVMPPASTHHDDNSVRQRGRDNNTQEYDYNSLTPGGKLACDHGAAQLARSEITIKKGDADIHCYDSYYIDGPAGTAKCTATNFLNRRCDHYRVWFNTSIVDYTPDNALERNYWMSLGCHEFGHTGSITHEDTSYTCMQTYISTTSYNPTVLTQADIDHINRY